MTEAIRRLEATTSPWWILLLEGIAAAILGLLLVTSPQAGATLLARIIGLYILVRGILFIVGLFVDGTQWFAKLIAGIIGIIAGIFMLEHPLWVSALVPTIITWTIGGLAILLGVVSLVHFYQGSGWGDAVIGVLCILLGVPLVFQPIRGPAVQIVLGIAALIGGIAVIVVAFRVRRVQEG
jgi:uncharacterized membrane protein HdeD (DUF308 family)